MNYRMILFILGWVLNFESVFLLLPSVTALCYGESAGWSFLLTAGFCLLTGVLITRKKPKQKNLYSRDGFVIVSLSWIVLSLFGAVPFVLSGTIPDFIAALFESVSGFTTTGASILTDVEVVPKCCLMWRSFTNWIGGMGVLVFIMAFLPLSGAGNMNLMRAESPGPSVGKLVPRIKTTALLLYGMYLVLTVAELICLLIAKMPFFEALNTTFATAGTGGFGVRNDSFGGFSTPIQMIVAVFMILFGINFNFYFLLLCRRFADALKTTEVWVYLGIMTVSTGIITFQVREMYGSLQEAFYGTAFSVSSVMTSTGFSTVDFGQWPVLSQTILVLLMFIGACAGSTGGGIKVSRIMILFKSMAKEISVQIHPKQIKKTKMDGRIIPHEVVRSVNGYMVVYLLMFVISVLVISLDNHDMVTNFTAVAATMNNIGPGLSMVGPTGNFSFFSDPAKCVLILDMLAGRLELFPILLLFAPATWKK